MRVVFLSLYPIETASTRQRIYNNVRHLPADFSCEVLPGIESVDQRPGRLGRGRSVAAEVARKLGHFARARSADVIVVQKGLTAMSFRLFPRLLFGLGPPVVFDFDDAVHLGPAQSFRSPALAWLSDPGQVIEMLPRFAAVVAGNRFLGELAARYNRDVEVIGTPMDTDLYRPRRASAGGLVVGWSGSSATNHYTARLAPIMQRVAAEVPEVELRIISNDDPGIDWSAFGTVRTSFVAWCLESLVADLHGFDIGLMPLVDDEWSRCKCGGKILQYMACGIPPVASPVGINGEVIADGISGLLARTDDEWVEHIVALARSPSRRERMGAAARQAIEERHSNRVAAPKLAAVLRRAADGRGNRGPRSRDGARREVPPT